MSLLDAEGVMNGDIWSNGAFNFESPLKDLLDSGNYTLEQILAEDELLQELRGLNPQLIDFFSTEETVAGLLQYIILAPKKKANANANANTKPVENGNASASVDPNAAESEASTATTSNNNNNNNTSNNEPGKWLQGEDIQGEDANQTRQQQKTQQQQEDDVYVRFPYMACEVICCELKGVINIIVDGFVPLTDTSYNDDEGEGEGEQKVNKESKSSSMPTASTLLSDDAKGRSMLDLFFSILYESEYGEIDDYRAGYFEKVLSVLLRTRPSDIAEYLNDGGGKGNTTLMSAMFKHLYSHSLMQIAQRLLLPQPPLPPKPEDNNDESKDDVNECEDLFNDPLEGTDTDTFEQFRCNWSESESALRIIVGCLTDDDSSDKNNSQTSTSSTTELIEEDENDDQEDRKLNLYRNSSEVLITIIQNSPLTSRTMCILTTDPVLETLIHAATHIEEGSEFSRHDSRQTCAMGVIESLVLQLGGYGSVGTILHNEDQDALENALEEILIGDDKATTEETTGEGETPSATSDHHQPLSSTKTNEKFATPATLVRHLPSFLLSLNNLLLYPGAENWVSPMQFSRTKPQQILGSSRLRIVRLLESLVLLGNQNIDSILCESSCLETCLDLFWKFQWCSMLHQSVANLLVHVFEGQNARSELQSYFIVRCNLLGRLMYSFWDEQAEGGTSSFATESNTELSESVMGQKDSDSENSPTVSSVLSEKGNSVTDDVLPVSDDDVDAAMEQEQDAVSFPGLEPSLSNDEVQTRDSSTGDQNDVKEPSLRLGYMGHVIIICQALVQAYTEGNDAAEDTDDVSEEMVVKRDQISATNEMDESDTEDCTSAGDESPSESLMLTRLVKKHPLGKIWQDFVLTKLAAETNLQTTPLGGFQSSTLGTDPLHMHRPGLEEDDGGYDDDDGEAPALPHRDHIDMDDNDLEVAANMMAGFNLGQGAGNNGDNLAQSNVLRSGYIFDDPLGSGRFADFEDDDDDDDDHDDGDSSSDEEPEISDNTRTSAEDGASSEHEAPVLDLFAGNFDAFAEAESVDPPFSDFANFDDAAFADTQNVDDGPEKEEKNNFDSIFGDVKSRDILLDEFDESPRNGLFDEPATVDREVTAEKTEAV
eukprot:jgi/Psemu1/235234/estExt_Genewise1.C_260144